MNKPLTLGSLFANKEIRKAELNQEQPLKTFQMIGLVRYVESAKKILNRTKDKTKRENY